jgi:hypothetical protein
MATQIQAAISGALQDLGFEDASGGPPGSPEKLKIAKATVDKIKSLEGNAVMVNADGTVSQG